MVALAKTGIACPGAERCIEALVAEPHLIVHRHAARRDPAAGLGAFLPIVHIVLLEGAAGAEAAHPGQPERLLDFSRRRFVAVTPRPHRGSAGGARAASARG